MATYYWVGGTGTWDGSNAANWSLTSGGLPGVSAPTSIDTVIFNSASGTGTCTTAAGSACAIATLNSSTLALTLGANHTMSGTFTLTLGALSLGSFTLTCQIFSSNNANVRSIAFGTGNISVTGNGAGVWVMNALANFSYTGTSNVRLTYSGAVGTRQINHGYVSGGNEANSISFNVTAGTDIVVLPVDGSAFIKDLNFTGFAGTFTIGLVNNIYGNIIFVNGMTVSTSVRTFSLLATSGTQQITTNGKTLDFPITQNGVSGTVQLQDNLTMGSTRTFTLTNGTLDLSSGNRTLSTGLFASTNSNTRVIAFGTGNITTTGSGTVWNTASTTGFSYTGTPTVNISNNSATATTVSTGAMIETRALNFNYTTGTYTLTDTSAVYKSVNFTGFSGTIPNSTRIIYGGATFSAGMTLTAGANITTFAATSGTNNITTAAKTLDFPITFFGLGGTFSFQDALTQGATRAFTFTAGTVQFKASATSTTGVFATSGASQKFLQSTTPGSTATLSQASGTVNASYLTIRDITAIGGATWFAPISQFNVDVSNNDGWDFFVQLGQYMYTRRKNKRLLIS